MSVKVMQMIWERAPYVEHGLILVLLALADWANEDGFCWPSMDLLAQKSRQSRRNITYILRRLEDDEVIDLQRGNGRGHATHYRINIERLQSLQPVLPLKDAKPAKVAPFIKPQRVQRVQPATVKGAISDISHNKDARADPLDPSIKETALPQQRQRSERGTRLPEDWQPTESDLRWAHGKGYHIVLNLEDVTEAFHLYWQSRAKDNTKLNWSLTWKNRVMELAKHEQDTRARFPRKSTVTTPQYFSDGSLKGEI